MNEAVGEKKKKRYGNRSDNVGLWTERPESPDFHAHIVKKGEPLSILMEKEPAKQVKKGTGIRRGRSIYSPASFSLVCPCYSSQLQTKPAGCCGTSVDNQTQYAMRTPPPSH